MKNSKIGVPNGHVPVDLVTNICPTVVPMKK